MAQTQPRGAVPLTLRSWPFGAKSRRDLLEVVLASEPADKGWTRREFERLCGVKNTTLDAHLDHLVALGLLRLDGLDGRFYVERTDTELARTLKAVLIETRKLPEARPAPLARRSYRSPHLKGGGRLEPPSAGVSPRPDELTPCPHCGSMRATHN